MSADPHRDLNGGTLSESIRSGSVRETAFAPTPTPRALGLSRHRLSSECPTQGPSTRHAEYDGSVQRAHADIERFSVSPFEARGQHLHVAAGAGTKFERTRMSRVTPTDGRQLRCVVFTRVGSKNSIGAAPSSVAAHTSSLRLQNVYAMLACRDGPRSGRASATLPRTF